MNPFDIFNDIFNENDFPGMGGMGGFPGVNIRMGGPFGNGFTNVHIRRQLGDTLVKIGITLEEVMKGCSKEVIVERDLNGKTDKKKLAELMVGRKVNLRTSRKKMEQGEVLLEVNDLVLVVVLSPFTSNK